MAAVGAGVWPRGMNNPTSSQFPCFWGSWGVQPEPVHTDPPACTRCGTGSLFRMCRARTRHLFGDRTALLPLSLWPSEMSPPSAILRRSPHAAKPVQPSATRRNPPHSSRWQSSLMEGVRGCVGRVAWNHVQGPVLTAKPVTCSTGEVGIHMVCSYYGFVFLISGANTFGYPPEHWYERHHGY